MTDTLNEQVLSEQTLSAFWPKGVPRQVSAPHVSLTHYLQVAAERFPEKPAIVFSGQSIGYRQLLESVEALAVFLQRQMALAHGDRVLLLSQNCPEFTIASYGVMRAGGVVVPVNPMSKASELAYYIENSQAKIVICAQDLLAEIKRQVIATDLRLMVFAYTGDEERAMEIGLEAVPERVWPLSKALSAANGLRPSNAHPKVSDLCMLPYTSGTTGHPKGCMHTHASILAANLGTQSWRGFHMDTVFLAAAPLFHMLGMQAGMNLPITLGATVVMMARWNAELAAELIEQYRVSAWSAPPAMLIDFFSNPVSKQRDFSSLARLSGGGAAMPEAIALRLKDEFGLEYNEAYGMTETAAYLLCNPPLRGKRACLGISTQAVDTRIIDPETMQELPQGELGELVTSGAQVMQGYWQNEQANKDAFIEMHGRRYLRTGDLAFVDEEGYYFMRDRLKRMINASGYKVWPAEVEMQLYDHPGIHEACVVSAPDAKRGETVAALIVCKPNVSITPESFEAWCRERMANYKVPRMIRFMESLPKSGTGKVAWRQLQEEFWRA